MRARLASLLVLVAIIVSSMACHTIRFEVSDEAHDEVVYDRKSFWLWGLVPTKEVDVSQFCPAGVAAIKEETRFSDGFFQALTLGIYEPRSSWYYCLPEGRP